MRFFLSSLFLLNITSLSYADDALSNAPLVASSQYASALGATGNASPSGANTPSLSEYLINFAQYLGYNIQEQGPAPSSVFLTGDTAFVSELPNMITMFIGAIPVNTVSKLFTQLVSPGNVNNPAEAASINQFANATFAFQSYGNPEAQQYGAVSVNPLIDQHNNNSEAMASQSPYQNDPVNQFIMNIITTPDYSFCMTGNGQSLVKSCQYLDQLSVMNNILGATPDSNGMSDINLQFPGPAQFADYSYNAQYAPKLNSNALIAPLLYTIQDEPNSNTSSIPQAQEQSQAQLAADFIRYASGAASPLPLINFATYKQLYNAATFKAMDNNSAALQLQAQAGLARYLTALRVYMAQTSVGVSNLYYILSKRLPQKVPSNNNSGASVYSSQALSEFQMATWRINPFQQNTQPWVAQMNNASPATVQKEMALLLAEINYQLYLNRQVDERMLLTNSILLLQNSHLQQPEAVSLNNMDANS